MKKQRDNESDFWLNRAIKLKNAIYQAMGRIDSKNGESALTPLTKEQAALDSVIKLAMNSDPGAGDEIRNYLSSGLPGFSWDKAKAGEPQSPDTLQQHRYLTGYIVDLQSAYTSDQSEVLKP